MRTRRAIAVAGAGLLAAAAVGGCSRGERSASGGPAGTAPARVAATEGFQTPESALYDNVQDVWWVSNINGDPQAKDGNGFISRVRSDGAIDSLHFIQGGRDGVILDAPKGLALAGDTLWVADIDVVRAFDRRSGRPLGRVDLAPEQVSFVNDLARGGDLAIYATEMAVRFEPGGQLAHPGPDRVFRIMDGRATVALTNDTLQRPNGIAWDPIGRRMVIASYMGPGVWSWTPGTDSLVRIADGPGQQDGVAVLRDGRIFFSSWADSSVYVIEKGATRRLIRGLPSPADLGVDERRGLMMVPLLAENRVELWKY